MYNLVKAIKALSDETRLRMLNLVTVRECCVCEIVQAMEISQTRASRNLMMLYDAGFLKLRKEGLWSLYSLDKENIQPCLLKLVEGVQAGLVDNKIAREDRKRLETACRTGACYSNSENTLSTSVRS